MRDVHCLDASHHLDNDVLSGMVNRAVVALTDVPSIPRAFASVFSSGKTVLLKVAPGVHEAVLHPLVRGLLMAGVSAGKIVLYRKPRRDRRTHGDGLCRFARGYGICLARAEFSHPTEKAGSKSVHLADAFYDCDGIINVTRLQHPGSARSGGSLLNHLDSVRETRRLNRTRAADVLGLNALPVIRDKTCLLVCDAVEPVFDVGGAEGAHSWPYCGVILADDPVALDTVGAAIISRHRRRLGLDDTMDGAMSALMSASRWGLGNSRGERIDLVQIDV